MILLAEVESNSADHAPGMIRKSGNRFSEEIMLNFNGAVGQR
jgi:hypothetical protein